MPAFAAASPQHRTLGDDEVLAIVAHIRTWEGSQ
jgi:hypothetical protein